MLCLIQNGNSASQLEDRGRVAGERCVGGLSEEARVAWRERFIRLSKAELDIELICPQNKTDQLVLKDMFDQGLFELPVRQITLEDFQCLHVRLARGVEVFASPKGWRVINPANGGELEIGNELLPVFRLFKRGATLDGGIRFSAFVERLDIRSFHELSLPQ